MSSHLSSHGSDAGEDEDEPELKHKKTSHVLGSNTSTNTHAFILCGLIMLSFDGLNPVKRIHHLIYHTEDASRLGWLFVFLLVCAVLQDFANVLFYGARIFLNAIMSISISKVDVIGTEHIPTSGPVILVANHQNQFVDGMCIVCSCQQRKLSFMVARKSYNHPLIGLFARVMASVPVARPQDMARKGKGGLLRISAEDPADAGSDVGTRLYRLVGSESCDFASELTAGSKVSYEDVTIHSQASRKGSTTWTWRVVSAESRCVAIVQLDSTHKAPPADVQASLPADGSYRVLPRGDFEEAFAEVCVLQSRGSLHSLVCLLRFSHPSSSPVPHSRRLYHISRRCAQLSSAAVPSACSPRAAPTTDQTCLSSNLASR